MKKLILFALAGIGLALAEPHCAQAADGVEPLFAPPAQARFRFDGPVGQRIKADIDNWLLVAPRSNPGMLEMFRVRDRQPTPNLVPWAGEFVGKYLISAIQALRLAERPEFRALVSQVVADLIAAQAEDGYLGPFPRQIRLKANWDLWGHYHVMLALLMWQEATGDPAALKACERAADLMAATFLDGSLRVFDAGSHEMNMAVVHGLGRLYRLTHQPRYLQLMREIERDWERAGDYFRTGLNGLEFFETPRPRWESLHDLEGLLELGRATSNPAYVTAFAHHWRSIVRWDRRNTGGFSSGEQATGNPYAPTAIETCCTVAWMALTADMLQWTGQARAADELELSFFNAALGAQHPSGRWCTYNTPMDGAREASAHTIVFQARAGTPELNCCSVNGPRALGLLSEWAVLSGQGALMVNYYGPGTFQGHLSDNTPVSLSWVTDYPLTGRVVLRVEPLAARTFRLLLRIPAWSQDTTVEINGKDTSGVTAGQYLELTRRWEPGDQVTVNLDLRLRLVPGDREVLGRASVYRGPVLLAYDQALNTFDADVIPPLDRSRMAQASASARSHTSVSDGLEPWLTMDLPAEQGKSIRVCDFASAGARGTQYRSWLPVAEPFPPEVVTRSPKDGVSIGTGTTRFRWTGPKRPGHGLTHYDLFIGTGSEQSNPIVAQAGLSNNWSNISADTLRRLPVGQPCWWRIVAVNRFGSTPSVGPSARFVMDPAIPTPPGGSQALGDADDLVVTDLLAGRIATAVGIDAPELSPGVFSATGPDEKSDSALRTDGATGKLLFNFNEFPDESYSLSVWANIETNLSAKLGQVCSAWSGPMDDPLGLCVEAGKLSARIEAGQGYSTPGIAVPVLGWHHFAVVKDGTDLRLYIDGQVRSHTVVPLFLHTSCRQIGLGGNPKFPGNECLAARFARLRFYSRALSPEELTREAKGSGR